MALGDVTVIHSDAKAIELLASATAVNGAPAAAAGISADAVKQLLGLIPKKLRVALRSTAGSGVMTVTARLWQRLGALGWVPSESLNAGAAIAEAGTDLLAHSDEFDTLEGADRFYLEITAIGGTATAVTGYLVSARQAE
jgi:hypothetical protein